MYKKKDRETFCTLLTNRRKKETKKYEYTCNGEIKAFESTNLITCAFWPEPGILFNSEITQIFYEYYINQKEAVQPYNKYIKTDTEFDHGKVKIFKSTINCIFWNKNI